MTSYSLVVTGLGDTKLLGCHLPGSGGGKPPGMQGGSRPALFLTLAFSETPLVALFSTICRCDFLSWKRFSALRIPGRFRECNEHYRPVFLQLCAAQRYFFPRCIISRPAVFAGRFLPLVAYS